MRLILFNPQLHLMLGLIGLGVVFFGSITSSPFAHADLAPNSDKFIHATAYGLLFLWFAQLLTPQRYVYLGLALFCYGALIELIQGQLPHRSASGLDMLANLSGIMVAMCICMAIVEMLPKEVNEQKR